MYRLLIADDEEEIRKGLASYFPWEEIGFTVVATAADGEQALELARRQEIDVIFCDIRMPVMSGVELAKAIFEEKLEIPVVFLSAHKDFAYAKQALDYGVRCYILKPTNYAEVASAFKKLKGELDYRLGSTAEPEEGEAGVKGETIVARVKRYMEREYARATLERAAAIVRKNPQYLSRLFKQEAGVNFNEYLTRIRMEKAAQLLSDVSYLTYQVSEIVGYSDPKSFTHTFRRYFGVSPRDFRRSS